MENKNEIVLDVNSKRLGCVAIVVSVVCLIAGFFVWGFVISKIWGWTLVPVGLPALGFIQGVLLKMILTALFTKNPILSIKSELNSMNEQFEAVLNKPSVEEHETKTYLEKLAVVEGLLEKFRMGMVSIFLNSVGAPLITLFGAYILTRFI